MVDEDEEKEFNPVNVLKAKSQEDCKLVSPDRTARAPHGLSLIFDRPQVLVVRNDLGMSTGKIAAQYVKFYPRLS